MGTNMKPHIIVDFDGVIHSYTSKWVDASTIPDEPVPGAVEFLKEAVKHFTVNVVSSRSHQINGILAMSDYIEKMCIKADCPEILQHIYFPVEKPPAIITIDDRAFCFKGTFPSIDEIKSFKPWNKP